MAAAQVRRGRRPGSESARAQILDSARSLFAEVGFHRATIRAIAKRADVDPALVHHFFGTKDQLLAATLALPIDPGYILSALDDSPGDEGRALVRRVLEAWSLPEVRDGFTALLRSAVSHDQAQAALRLMLTTGIINRLRDRLGHEQAELRAALVASQIAGLALTRYVIEIEPMASATDDELVDAVGPTIQRYLTGDLTASRS